MQGKNGMQYLLKSDQKIQNIECSENMNVNLFYKGKIPKDLFRLKSSETYTELIGSAKFNPQKICGLRKKKRKLQDGNLQNTTAHENLWAEKKTIFFLNPGNKDLKEKTALS